uniref:Pentacotripeptide-repeat region of PRORP domain-containing protein n=1 Tax=Romanomermis culicivorax TaxID=13658 RepID=A0A915KZP8_ROMCU
MANKAMSLIIRQISLQYVKATRNVSLKAYADYDKPSVSSSSCENWKSEINSSSRVSTSRNKILKKTDTEEDADDNEVVFTPFVVHKHPPLYYRDLCKKLAAEGKLAEAVAVVEKRMFEDRVRPEKFNYATIIHLLARAGQSRKAMEFFRKMRTAGYEPGFKIVTSLMNACANAPEAESQYALEQTKWLFKREKHQYGSPRHQTIYYAAMKCFARHNDLESAFQYADDMIRDGFAIKGDIFCYLLSAAISDKEAGFKLALQIWRLMRSLNVRFNLYHYNLILKACREAGLGENTNSLLKSVAKKSRTLLKEQRSGDSNALLTPGQSSDVHNVSIAKASVQSLSPGFFDRIDIRAAVGPENIKFTLLGGFEQILKKMNADKIQPDLKFCTNVLSLLPVSHEVESQLIEFGRQNHVEFDTEFFNLLIFRRAIRGEYESALACLDEFHDRKLRPNIRTFEALAIARRTSTHCLEMLRDMKNIGLTPNKRIFQSCLGTALKQFNFFYVRNILSQMSKFNVNPDKSMLKSIEDKLSEVRLMKIREKEAPNFTNVSLLKVTGRDEFLEYYEDWLKRRIVSPENHIDPKLTMLQKEVDADDLRDDWEKPWALNEQKKEEKAKFGDDEIEILP